MLPWEQIAPYITSASVSTICVILLFNFLAAAKRSSLDGKAMQQQLMNLQKMMLLDRLPAAGADNHDEICEKCRSVADKILACLDEQKEFIERIYREESK